MRGFYIGTVPLALMLGCSDPASSTRYFESADDEASGGQHQELMRAMTELNSIDGAVDLVRATYHPDFPETMTMEQWVQAERALIAGDVMFPKWDGRRLGSHRFEVRYTHTVIDYDYNIQKSGYSWDVDTVVKIVKGPHPLEPADLDQRLRRTGAEEDFDPAATIDFSLE
jgi:hypothetical protein